MIKVLLTWNFPMKVFTPMMAKINQKMMHTVNTLKMLEIQIIFLQ